VSNDADIEATVQAYGLRGFPYAIRELDPVQDDGDIELICFVAGWEQADEVGAFLGARAAARKPALVVVAGGSGTGRTSLANYLIRKWADGRSAAPKVNFDRTKLVVASGQMSDFDAEAQLWQWVLDLWPQILIAGFEPDEATEKAFDGLVDTKPQAMASALQKVLMKLTVDLHTKGGALAGILEDVKKQEILALARDAFRFVDALLVTTVESTSGNFDAVLSNVEEALGSDIVRIVTLDNLYGPQAGQVVMTRWKMYSNPDHKLPFNESVLDAGFADKARPFARVLTLMETLLVQKQIDFAKGQQWPAAKSLAFSEDEMRRKVSFWDARIRVRK
jgi:hypothetical protein